MPKGTNRNSGPPPDPNALKRERDPHEYTDLPPEGREGPTPEWPLPQPTKRERELWEREWSRPQAVMWEANGQEVEVALYIRLLRQVEQPKAGTPARVELRRQMDALGLTVPGMNQHRWRIRHTEGKREPAKREGPSTKERLRIIDGQGA